MTPPFSPKSKQSYIDMVVFKHYATENIYLVLQHANVGIPVVIKYILGQKYFKRISEKYKLYKQLAPTHTTFVWNSLRLYYKLLNTT